MSWDDFSANATGEEQADYVAAIGATARKLGINTSGYRILANHGHDSHQEVLNLHVHILAGHRWGRCSKVVICRPAPIIFGKITTEKGCSAERRLISLFATKLAIIFDQCIGRQISILDN